MRDSSPEMGEYSRSAFILCSSGDPVREGNHPTNRDALEAAVINGLISANCEKALRQRVSPLMYLSGNVKVVPEKSRL